MTKRIAVAALVCLMVLGWWGDFKKWFYPEPTEQHGTSGGRGPTIRPPETIFHPHSEPEGIRRIAERERRGP